MRQDQQFDLATAINDYWRSHAYSRLPKRTPEEDTPTPAEDRDTATASFDQFNDRPKPIRNFYPYGASAGYH